MTSAKSVHGHFQRRAVKLFTGNGNNTFRAVSSRTACGENALVFGVEIKHTTSFYRRTVKFFGTEHSYFFIGGQQNFQCGVRNVRSVEKSQTHCNGNAVIAAERRAFCIEHITVKTKVKPLGQHIFFAVRRLFADHIGVSLYYNGRGVFIARRRRFFDYKIMRFVTDNFKVSVTREFLAKIRYRVKISRPVRDSTYLFKNFENLCGSKPCGQIFHIITTFDLFFYSIARIKVSVKTHPNVYWRQNTLCQSRCGIKTGNPSEKVSRFNFNFWDFYSQVSAYFCATDLIDKALAEEAPLTMI